MIADWIIATIIAVTLQIVAYVITPKPKGPKPEAVQQAENPTASAGKPIGVPFGSVIIKEVNVLWFGQKATLTREVEV